MCICYMCLDLYTHTDAPTSQADEVCLSLLEIRSGAADVARRDFSFPTRNRHGVPWWFPEFQHVSTCFNMFEPFMTWDSSLP